MKSAPGYPLPSGELGSDDIVCQLVYLPDRPEYWQALMGALSYMATWRAWERDSDKRGKDAAADWRNALELTTECWRMACLQELQDDVAEILAIMQLGNPCCDDMDITDGDQYTDRVEDGEGDVPQNIIDAGYADDAEDWDGFADYKCMISHVAVNQMSARLNELNELVNEYGAIAGSAAAIAAILAVIFATGGVAIVFGLVAGVGAVSLLYESLMGFPLLGNLADKVDTNHDELVCAIYFADGDAAALIALNDKIDELFTSAEAVILKNLNNGPTLKSLYSGRYDQTDIAKQLEAAGYELDDFDCDGCDQIGEYLVEYPFDADLDSWVLSGGAVWTSYDGGVAYLPHEYGHIWHSVQTLRADAGLNPVLVDGYVDIHRIVFYYKNAGPNAGDCRMYCGTHDVTYDNSDGVYTRVEEIFSPPKRFTHPTNYIISLSIINSLSGNMTLDNIVVDFDANET